MERLKVALLLGAVCGYGQTAEHVIPQPHSFGYSFEGAALAKPCVAALKTEPAVFLRRFPATPPQMRRPCVDQLLQALTWEPDFTAQEFQAIIANDPHRNLSPKDPEVARRIQNRLGVNIHVSEAVVALARAGMVDDPKAIPSLIHCLGHPLLEVSRHCQDALVVLTRHGYGVPFPSTTPTEEARQRSMADWTEWYQQMKNGHPLLDDWLESRCLSAVHRIGERLEGVLKMGAYGYLQHAVTTAPRLRGIGEVAYNYPESLFDYDVGSHNAANWMTGASVEGIGVSVIRPGILKPRSRPLEQGVGTRFGGWSVATESVYREGFPALDLEVQVAVVASDVRLREASFVAVRGALRELRQANTSLR